ncbi:uncharacterized protein LOC126377542 [Pectinophora gossypiella]|uniref:uncharacterized protein LOC126377542 n=1 Tax=Pectinophora gossypiella TaxID=13191 RepID=UPI00214E7B9C|nr:uncharacterized protein LOC126377542 [Pectinophora gossypiella]
MRFYILILIFYLAKHGVAEFFYKPSPTEQLVTGVPRGIKVPWMGILRVKQTFPLTDAVANVILITRIFAISNANEIHDLDEITMRNKTSVHFYSDPKTIWKCYVEDFILHPEFSAGKINTIGLIHLGTEQKLLGSIWKPVAWPPTYFNAKDVQNIYTVSFSDQTRTLEQVVYKMETVDFINCTDTYIKEGLSFPTIWPKYYTCFRASEQLETCVYDAGMAAATNTTGDWTLIGISIYGPGCSFPARFIEFYPYIPWVQGVLESKMPERIQYTRRQDDTTTDNFITTSRQDLDKDIMSNLNVTIAMDTTETNKEVIVYGDCKDKKNRVYADDGYIKIRQDLEITTALYSVSISLQDLNLTCITTFIKCKRKSKTTVLMRKGFGQEDIHFLVQRVPQYKIGTKEYAERVLFIKGSYLALANMPVVTIWFKFEIVASAFIKVNFYARHEPPAVLRTKKTRPTYAPIINKQFQTRGTKTPSVLRKMVKNEDNIQQDYYEPETEQLSYLI